MVKIYQEMTILELFSKSLYLLMIVQMSAILVWLKKNIMSFMYYLLVNKSQLRHM